MNKIYGVIVLAGGQGKRMASTTVNKVALPIANKPLIRHSLERVMSLPIRAIVVVVGFAKESVMQALKGIDVIFAEQKEQLGTAHALSCGLDALPKEITDVLVIQGDDFASYPQELLVSLFTKQQEDDAVVTFLTIDVENPTGLGRVIRNQDGSVAGIVEEKDATEDERKITEINPACYVFSVDFLRDYLPKVTKSIVTGEYYLTSLIDMAIKDNKRVTSVKGGILAWRGVNTQEELEQAEKVYQGAIS